eukprot:CAMPEP_0201521190 /NCGR_PEP_ID=MMETSP0161_2-20130828/14273_1 /ASSEMBLY_ACC=CAM_ASM_000251 /TAXON_ID=180227 /ORGANISM="Neoparamoeba aestuarina, Strain SoJaBio B1-5/56/2" /LENGTH=141 /DNA_ID=CAMNT_0047919779 /DNA_START=411 /DNA_END=836 /DNA_ORIENTATION=+
MAHTIAGLLFMFFGFAYAAEYLMACYYHPTRPRVEPGRKCNPIYLNSNIYDTPFPLLTAFSMSLIACWWLEMAFYLFAEPQQHNMEHNMDHNMNSDMMASMLISDMVYNMFMWCIGGFTAFYLICTWFDRVIQGEGEKEEV